MKKILTFINIFLTIEFFCINIIFFSIILFVTTLLQKNIGIDSIIELFFSSYIIWIYNILPIPGGKSIAFFVAISLFIKIIKEKNFLSKIGFYIIHIGAFIFFISIFINSIFNEEGYVIIKENKSINYFINNNNFDIVVLNNNENILNIIKKKKIFIKELFLNDYKFFFDKFNKNSDIHIYYNLNNKTNYNIKELLLFPETEHNTITLEMTFVDKNIKKNIILIENIKHKIIERNIEIYFKKNKTEIPFYIKLIKFKKKNYIQTKMAKSYSSLIEINENGVKWKKKIKMNKPLRLKGYTFYQSSFIEKNNTIYSVLLVSKNNFTYLFYISSFVIIIGVLIQMFKILFNKNV